jgi:hypothetical protein
LRWSGAHLAGAGEDQNGRVSPEPEQAAAGARARSRGEVVGRRSGLTDRAIESVGSGRDDLVELGRLGQTGFGPLN